MTQPTDREIAASFDLWREYVDPDATTTREEFDALDLDERLALMASTFGPSVPTVEEVLDRSRVDQSGECAWGVEGGTVAIDEVPLRLALEAAYDPTMPDWPATVDLDA